MPAFTSVRPLCTAVNTYLDKVQLVSDNFDFEHYEHTIDTTNSLSLDL